MKGMTSIVKTITDWTKGLIVVLGIYIVLYGHLSPGGGFAGGVVIAVGLILATLAYGEDSLSKKFAKKLDSLSAITFSAIAFIALCIGKPFFENFIMKIFKMKPFRLVTAGTIPLSNIAIGLKVSSSIFLIFMFIASMKFVLSKSAIEYDIEEIEEE